MVAKHKCFATKTFPAVKNSVILFQIPAFAFS
jgi:hypothetical protein